MITNVQVVTVYVSDQNKALDFYVNKLGFEKRADQDFGPGLRWLEVAPGGAQTVLVLAKGYGGDEQERIGKFTGIVFEAQDIYLTYETLQKRGVHFTEAPTPQAWGAIQALFADQDNNGFVMVQRM